MEFKNSYPIQYILPLQLDDNVILQLRPIHPLDGKKAAEFKATLSARSIHDRFLGYIPNIAPGIVDQLTKIDYSKDMAIIVEIPHEESKPVIAVARIAGDGELNADFAIIISDDWQGKGLGVFLTKYLVKIAKDLGYKKIYATFFNHNIGMAKIFKKLNFEISDMDDQTQYAQLIF